MSRSPLRLIALVGAVVLGLSAWGSRSEDKGGESAAPAPGAASLPSGGGEATSAAPTPDAGAPIATAGGNTATPAGAASANVATGGAGGKTTATGGAAPSAKTGSSGAAPAGSATPGRPGTSTDPAAPATPGTPAAPVAGGAKETIVLGNTGTFSGPVGTALAGITTGVQTWASAVNERGGVDGHPVKVISVDDGGDPARSKANVKDLVERRGAIAIIGDMSVITRSGHAAYLLEKKIPVIGGDIASPEWPRNAMYFGNGPHVQALIYGTVQEMASLGKKKLAVLYCAEVQSCGDVAGWAKTAAKDFGVEVVYEQKISVAQPDFTAECLSAKNAGADTLWPANDGNSTGRMATSCKRQGYTPLYVNAHSTQSANMSGFDGLEGGLYGTTPQAPWFLTNETPGIKEYRDALNRLAPQHKPGQEVINGWSSGKLFEKALTNLGATPAKVTSADVLRGLYTISNDTIGGLLPPITFTSGQTGSPVGQCWFVDQVKDKEWVAPHGATPVCTDHKFVYETSQ